MSTSLVPPTPLTHVSSAPSIFPAASPVLATIARSAQPAGAIASADFTKPVAIKKKARAAASSPKKPEKRLLTQAEKEALGFGDASLVPEQSDDAIATLDDDDYNTAIIEATQIVYDLKYVFISAAARISHRHRLLIYIFYLADVSLFISIRRRRRGSSPDQSAAR